ncbi:hypothetical protein BN1080_01939 [Planococcus massiliensis]|uniref:Uncharacterized protein n=1 Tax=Planococcus massiliensis TaxID=1499687 RepID=A0A098EMG8_9BACL|nr:hypothetical protein [Planococcus massiliensis]CEG23000.1 hypothetical protein BN1080_01939 [Planococcus massiliensis]
MEGFIFALIVMALGAIFGNKKGGEDKDPASKPVPKSPQTRQSRQAQAREAGQKTFKRVEDYAKEIYGDLQTQMKEQPEKTKQVQQRVEKAIDRTPLRETRQEIQREIQERQPSGRLSAHQNARSAAPAKPKQEEDIFPLEANNIRKGIILAEVLMPPKSKR